MDDESLKRLVSSSQQLLEAFIRAEANDYVKVGEAASLEGVGHRLARV